MNRKIDYFRHFSFRDFCRLSLGLLVDKVHDPLPTRILVAKKVIDHLHKNDGSFERRDGEMLVVLGKEHYVLRREGSDLDVFNQIVLEHGLRRVSELTRNLNISDLRIVDCGANIGLSALALKREFPNAKIVCMEPEPGNFSQLKKNIEANALVDVVPLQVGVWYEDATLEQDTTFRDGESWSFALKSSDCSEGQGFRVTSLDAVAAMQKWDRIDVLKIDIEGAEFPLFRNLDRWKAIWDTVRVVSVEVHAEKGPLLEIAEILWRSGFKVETDGELTIGVRENPPGVSS